MRDSSLGPRGRAAESRWRSGPLSMRQTRDERGPGVFWSQERQPAQTASVSDITENTQVSWNVISSQWSVLQARNMNLAFPHPQTHPGSTMVQLQRVQHSRAATTKTKDPPSSRHRVSPVAHRENKPLRDVRLTDSDQPALSHGNSFPSAVLSTCFSLNLRGDRLEALRSNHSSTPETKYFPLLFSNL